MNARTLLLLGLLCPFAALAAPPADKGPPACVPPPSCTPAPSTHRLYVPAGALSYGLPGSAFTVEARGLRWDSTDGTATLTIRRPLEYSGGDVTVSIFHQVLDDSGGDLAFAISPVSFNHLSGFETYGGELTTLVAVPEDPTALLEHEATLTTGTDGGYQWPPSGDWWYFEISRAGSFSGPLRLMSVAIDY